MSNEEVIKLQKGVNKYPVLTLSVFAVDPARTWYLLTHSIFAGIQKRTQ